MALNQHLVNHYPKGRLGTPSRSFWIDDQDDDDRYLRFCTISVELDDTEDRFDLILTNVPWNSGLEEFVEEINGRFQETPTGRNLTIPLTTKSAPVIRKLAKQIRKVTGRGQRYLDSNWKWITKRTAASLETFASVVAEYHRSRPR